MTTTIILLPTANKWIQTMTHYEHQWRLHWGSNQHIANLTNEGLERAWLGLYYTERFPMSEWSIAKRNNIMDEVSLPKLGLLKVVSVQSVYMVQCCELFTSYNLIITTRRLYPAWEYFTSEIFWTKQRHVFLRLTFSLTLLLYAPQQ